MNQIGQKIKAAIDSKGITQMALAEAVGVSNNAVTKWIKTGKISKANIPKIAKELDLTLSDFFDGEEGDLLHALLILQDPKLKALFFSAENLSESKKSALVQTSIALAEPVAHKNNGTK
jgi:transcriptional regulator with XRE-family HTH domain